MLRLTTLCAAALFAGLVSANAATLTLFDDTFDADSADVPSGYLTTTNLKKWNVTQGNVDILSTDYGCTGCVDLDGTGATVPAILVSKDVLHFAANVLYTFQLFFGDGSQDEKVTFAILNGIDFFATDNFIWTVMARPGVDTDSTISIKLAGPVDNLGPYLDRVLITYEASAVPLPAAAPLLLAGLGALGAVARRRRRA